MSEPGLGMRHKSDGGGGGGGGGKLKHIHNGKGLETSSGLMFPC